MIIYIHYNFHIFSLVILSKSHITSFLQFAHLDELFPFALYEKVLIFSHQGHLIFPVHSYSVIFFIFMTPFLHTLHRTENSYIDYLILEARNIQFEAHSYIYHNLASIYPYYTQAQLAFSSNFQIPDKPL